VEDSPYLHFSCGDLVPLNLVLRPSNEVVSAFISIIVLGDPYVFDYATGRTSESSTLPDHGSRLLRNVMRSRVIQSLMRSLVDGSVGTKTIKSSPQDGAVSIYRGEQ
jgi:hypothetical protein